VDSGVREGDEVTVHYDPMIAKVIAWHPGRTGAIELLREALEQLEVEGVRCNARYLWEILGADAVRAGEVSTRLLEHSLQPIGETTAERADAWVLAAAARLQVTPDPSEEAAPAATPWGRTGGFRMNGEPSMRIALRIGDERHWVVARAGSREGMVISVDGREHQAVLAPGAAGNVSGTIDGRRVTARIESGQGSTVIRRQCLRFEVRDDDGASHHASAEYEGHLKAPMPGHVLDVRAKVGARVAAGEVLVVLEAMKMEHSLAAPWDGTVVSVPVKPGDRVEEGVELVLLEPVGDAALRHPAAQD
jgi:3-methylcrotonyl-CoA carboxylase alpha subunit